MGNRRRPHSRWLPRHQPRDLPTCLCSQLPCTFDGDSCVRVRVLCVRVCVRLCAVRLFGSVWLFGSVCLHVSVNVWDREGVHVTVSATVPSPPSRNAIIQAAAIWLILIGVCPFITSIMGCVGTIMYIYTPPAL